jgi:hypothetical protein
MLHRSQFALGRAAMKSQPNHSCIVEASRQLHGRRKERRTSQHPCNSSRRQRSLGFSTVTQLHCITRILVMHCLHRKKTLAIQIDRNVSVNWNGKTGLRFPFPAFRRLLHHHPGFVLTA